MNKSVRYSISHNRKLIVNVMTKEELIAVINDPSSSSEEKNDASSHLEKIYFFDFLKSRTDDDVNVVFENFFKEYPTSLEKDPFDIINSNMELFMYWLDDAYAPV